MKIVGYALLRGLILAILITGRGSIGELRNLTHWGHGQALELRYTKSDYFNKISGPYWDCVEPSYITTGGPCSDYTDTMYPEYMSRILQNIIKSGTSKNEYNRMEKSAQELLEIENTLLEDWFWQDRHKCFKALQCKNGVCSCSETQPDYDKCLGHKQKEVHCTTQAAIMLQFVIAIKRTEYLSQSNCAKKSMAGKGEECHEDINRVLAEKYGLPGNGKDEIDLYSHMSEEDWRIKIKQTCVNGKCEGRTCQCPNGVPQCENHKRKDLDGTCRDQIKKTVKDFKAMSELINPRPPTSTPPTSTPPTSTPPTAKVSSDSTACIVTPIVMLVGTLISLAHL